MSPSVNCLVGSFLQTPFGTLSMATYPNAHWTLWRPYRRNGVQTIPNHIQSVLTRFSSFRTKASTND
ncbi:MAG: hypothetical protein ACTS7I_03160 [Candidatus Hodgkinia cicadicola]